MTAKLSKELSAALHATGDRELEVIDPDTERKYFLVDRETHLRAMEALRRRQDRYAIAQGIAEMEAGEGISVDEARQLTRARLVAREPSGDHEVRRPRLGRLLLDGPRSVGA